MRISVVVPVWNGRSLLSRLLDTLDVQTVRAVEVIAVDNGSDDGAPELATARGARVIAMGWNAGFAAAVNRGIGEARSEWVAVLNSDVELAPDYFERCSEAAATAAPRVWFVTGKILDARRNGTIDATFDLVCRGGTAWRAGSGKTDGPTFSEPRQISSAPWTAAVFRAEVFQKVGLLETRFESYLEDVDFGLRCAAYGVSGQYVPQAVAWHHGSATLGRWHPETVRRIARNQLFLTARHLPARCWWPVVVAQSLWGLVALRHGGGRAWLRGIWQGVTSFTLMRRTRVLSVLVLSDHFRDNERTIYRIQAATSFDFYWRLYFLLTRGEAK